MWRRQQAQAVTLWRAKIPSPTPLAKADKIRSALKKGSMESLRAGYIVYRPSTTALA